MMLPLVQYTAVNFDPAVSVDLDNFINQSKDLSDSLKDLSLMTSNNKAQEQINQDEQNKLNTFIDDSFTKFVSDPVNPITGLAYTHDERIAIIQNILKEYSDIITKSGIEPTSKNISDISDKHDNIINGYQTFMKTISDINAHKFSFLDQDNNVIIEEISVSFVDKNGEFTTLTLDNIEEISISQANILNQLFQENNIDKANDISFGLQFVSLTKKSDLFSIFLDNSVITVSTLLSNIEDLKSQTDLIDFINTKFGSSSSTSPSTGTLPSSLANLQKLFTSLLTIQNIDFSTFAKIAGKEDVLIQTQIDSISNDLFFIDDTMTMHNNNINDDDIISDLNNNKLSNKLTELQSAINTLSSALANKKYIDLFDLNIDPKSLIDSFNSLKTLRQKTVENIQKYNIDYQNNITTTNNSIGSYHILLANTQSAYEKQLNLTSGSVDFSTNIKAQAGLDAIKNINTDIINRINSFKSSYSTLISAINTAFPTLKLQSDINVTNITNLLAQLQTTITTAGKPVNSAVKDDTKGNFITACRCLGFSSAIINENNVNSLAVSTVLLRFLNNLYELSQKYIGVHASDGSILTGITTSAIGGTKQNPTDDFVASNATSGAYFTMGSDITDPFFNTTSYCYYLLSAAFPLMQSMGIISNTGQVTTSTLFNEIGTIVQLIHGKAINSDNISMSFSSSLIQNETATSQKNNMFNGNLMMIGLNWVHKQNLNDPVFQAPQKTIPFVRKNAIVYTGVSGAQNVVIMNPTAFNPLITSDMSNSLDKCSGLLTPSAIRPQIILDRNSVPYRCFNSVYGVLEANENSIYPYSNIGHLTFPTTSLIAFGMYNSGPSSLVDNITPSTTLLPAGSTATSVVVYGQRPTIGIFANEVGNDKAVYNPALNISSVYTKIYSPFDVPVFVDEKPIDSLSFEMKLRNSLTHYQSQIDSSLTNTSDGKISVVGFFKSITLLLKFINRYLYSRFGSNTIKNIMEIIPNSIPNTLVGIKQETNTGTSSSILNNYLSAYVIGLCVVFFDISKGFYNSLSNKLITDSIAQYRLDLPIIFGF